MIKNKLCLQLQTQQKIIHCIPTPDNTFMILSRKIDKTYCLAHISSESKVLFQSNYPSPSNLTTLSLVSQHHAILLHPANSKILQYNLIHHTILELTHNFHVKMVSHSLFVFPYTSLLCLAEYGDMNSNFFKLTYYRYPLQVGDQPVYVLQEQEINQDSHGWTYQFQVEKGDCQSMVLWYRSAYKQVIQFNSFDLNTKKITTHKIPLNSLKQLENQITSSPLSQKFQIHIFSIYHIKNNRFMISSITDREPTVDQPFPHSIFIYQRIDNHNEHHDVIFRQTKFKFEKQYAIKLIDIVPFGNCCMFRTFGFKNNQPIPTPTYFVNNQLEQFIHIDEWKCRYDPNLLVECLYENGNVKKVDFILYKALDARMTTAMFLIQIVGIQCDEAILSMVLEMVDLQI